LTDIFLRLVHTCPSRVLHLSTINLNRIQEMNHLTRPRRDFRPQRRINVNTVLLRCSKIRSTPRQVHLHSNNFSLHMDHLQIINLIRMVPHQFPTRLDGNEHAEYLRLRF